MMEQLQQQLRRLLHNTNLCADAWLGSVVDLSAYDTVNHVALVGTLLVVSPDGIAIDDVVVEEIHRRCLSVTDVTFSVISQRLQWM